MEQKTTWEPDSCSSDQKIPCLLWNLEACYNAHKSPSLGPVLSQVSTVHNLTLYSLKIHFNTILPSTPSSPKWLSSFQVFRLQICMHLSYLIFAIRYPIMSFSLIW